MPKPTTAPLPESPFAETDGFQLVQAGYGPTIDLEKVFCGPVERVRPSPGYVALTAVVAIFMLLLPLIYLSLIAGVGVGVYFYVMQAIELFGDTTTRVRGRALVLGLFLAALPVVMGLIVMFFMVKPLFAPRGKYAKPEPILRSEEPLLYAYVERLCKTLGAPVPREIVATCDINASAGFRHGIFSLFWNDLRLTIGMPLAAGLDLRQFSGVMAHELGHFSQRVAIRFSYLIDVVNHWLARVAYERDAWDLKLHILTYNDEGWVRVCAYITQGCVWVTRLILKGLCMAGAMASMALSRAMEYNADAFEARIAGSKSFAGFERRLHDLNEAMGIALEELTGRKEAERVPDNLPVLFASATDRMPPEQLDKAWKLFADRKVGLFQTHPSPNDRIAAAMKLDAPGVIALDAPARLLFKDFNGLCRRVTYQFIRAQIGGKVMDLTFAPVEEFVRAHEQTSRALASLEKVVGPEVLKTFSIRPMFLRIDALEAPADPGSLPERWNKAREAMVKLRPAADAAATALRNADDSIDHAVQAESLKRAGLKFDPTKYGLTKGTVQEAEDARMTALNARAAAEHSLEPFEKAYRQRVASALQLLTVKGIEARIRRAPELKAEANKLLVASAALRECFGTMYELSRRILAAQAIFTGSTRMASSTEAELNRLTTDIALGLKRAYKDLDVANYPFEHAQDGITIAGVLLERTPKEEKGPEVLSAAVVFRDGYMSLTRRSLARLAEIAIEVETAIKSGRGG